MRFWNLTSGTTKPAEQWKRPGKVEHYDYVSVYLDRREALQIVQRLANQLANGDDGPCLLTLAGRLERAEDDPDVLAGKVTRDGESGAESEWTTLGQLDDGERYEDAEGQRGRRVRDACDNNECVRVDEDGHRHDTITYRSPSLPVRRIGPCARKEGTEPVGGDVHKRATRAVAKMVQWSPAAAEFLASGLSDAVNAWTNIVAGCFWGEVVAPPAIRLTLRSADWHACIDGDAARWEAGRTGLEAINKLVISHPELETARVACDLPRSTWNLSAEAARSAKGAG